MTQAILFKGKQLGKGESLSSAGVAEGDTLNVVPTKGAGATGSGGGGSKARPVRCCWPFWGEHFVFCFWGWACFPPSGVVLGCYRCPPPPPP